MSNADFPTFDTLYASRYGYRVSGTQRANCVNAWNAALNGAIAVASQTKDRLINDRDYEAAAAARDVQELLEMLVLLGDVAS